MALIWICIIDQNIILEKGEMSISKGPMQILESQNILE